MSNIILFKIAACIDLACFRQFFFFFRRVANIILLMVLSLLSYLVLYIFCSQCLSRRFLREFSIPANTMLGGRLFQYNAGWQAVPVVCNYVTEKNVHTD